MVTTVEKAIPVGLGDIRVSRDREASLACLGVGSGIGLCLYDPEAKVAGMAHIVLPRRGGRRGGAPGAYADSAVPELVKSMCRLGAERSRLVAKLVGAARMPGATGEEAAPAFGSRNLAATLKALAAEGVPIVAAETGGSQGRSVWLRVGSGKVEVRVVGMGWHELQGPAPAIAE